jgi:hypothetical protein
MKEEIRFFIKNPEMILAALGYLWAFSHYLSLP